MYGVVGCKSHDPVLVDGHGMQKFKTGTQKGFTLIELLVVSSIIGLLSAISVQIFIEMRTRSYDARANADIRNVATAEDAYFAEFETFKSCANAASCSAVLPGVPVLSSGVVLSMTATTTGFTGSATHPKGSGLVYRWDSHNGGIQD
jgi:prepilin-type N-terminal cleavage/methylation domain-containing protein